jgi:hypothetical protein
VRLTHLDAHGTDRPLATLTHADGTVERVAADWVVGADGARSAVREHLGMDFPADSGEILFAIGDAQVGGQVRDELVYAYRRDGALGVAPLADGAFRIAFSVPSWDDGEAPPRELFQRMVDRLAPTPGEVGELRWSTVFRAQRRTARTFRAGRVFLAGDAAHTHPPTGGLGLNTSVQDAYNLGWKLAAVLASRAPAALLETYEEERRPIAAATLGLATKLLDATKRGDSRRGREVQQLDIGYAGSPLALDAPERRGLVVAGNRAPDAPLQGSAGKTRRLFELFAGAHWTLLAFNAERNLIAPRAGLHIHHIGAGGDLADSDGYFEGAYAPEPGQWWLVRPDGYVGAVVSSVDVERLDGYFATVGLVGETEVSG